MTAPLLPLTPMLPQEIQTPPEGSSAISTPRPGDEETNGGDAPSLLDGMLPFLMIGLVLWMLIFGPEKKARKKRQAMLDAVQKGDKVITTSGLHAEVVAVREHEVDVTAGGSRFTYSRAAINEILD